MTVVHTKNIQYKRCDVRIYEYVEITKPDSVSALSCMMSLMVGRQTDATNPKKEDFLELKALH